MIHRLAPVLTSIEVLRLRIVGWKKRKSEVEEACVNYEDRLLHCENEFRSIIASAELKVVNFEDHGLGCIEIGRQFAHLSWFHGRMRRAAVNSTHCPWMTKLSSEEQFLDSLADFEENLSNEDAVQVEDGAFIQYRYDKGTEW